MKISNETKVGALTAIAITVLILGFNFLKGKGINTSSTRLHTVFPNVEGLMVSNPVYINGLEVGKIAEIREKDKNLSGIVVSLNITKNINIPQNSVATLKSELLGVTSVNIHLGQGNNLAKDGDTLRTTQTLGTIEKLQGSVDPVLDNVNKTLSSLNDLVQKFNTVLDPNTRNNLQSIISDLAHSTHSLSQLLNTQTGMLAKSLNNINTITENFARNSGKLDTTFTNLEQVTSKLADAKIEEAVESLQNTLNTLEKTIAKLDSKDGTMGLLLNDRQLYDEIRSTNRSLNILLDDLRIHPKRYINISVFGKKDKEGPLMSPVNDSTKK